MICKIFVGPFWQTECSEGIPHPPYDNWPHIANNVWLIQVEHLYVRLHQKRGEINGQVVVIAKGANNPQSLAKRPCGHSKSKGGMRERGFNPKRDEPG